LAVYPGLTAILTILELSRRRLYLLLLIYSFHQIVQKAVFAEYWMF